MASTIRDFPPDPTSTRPFLLADNSAADKTGPAAKADRELRKKGLIPFVRRRAAIAICGAVSEANEFLDVAGNSDGTSSKTPLRTPPSDALLDSILDAVEAGNLYIKDKARRVTIVLVAPSIASSLVQIANEVVVELECIEEHVNAAGATHEMGHAIFDFYRNKQPELSAVAAGIFLRMTANVDAGRRAQVAACPGINMVSAQEWSTDKRILDHPQDNVDEFFASARTAFLINSSGLTAAIQRATQEDPERVQAAASDLLHFLDSLDRQARRKTPFDNRMNALIKSSDSPKSRGLVDSLTFVGKKQVLQFPDNGIESLLLQLR